MSATDVPATKATLRDWARATRAELMRSCGAERSAAAVALVRSAAAYRGAGTVACYRAFGSELDLTALAGDSGKRFVWPRTHGGPPPRLTMRLADPANEAAWERHRFGQPEPAAGTPEVDPRGIDVVLVPGLAFDVRGYRLGYGKGYYDRLLPLLRPDAAVVGVTLEALVVPELPHEEHDFRMGYLVTESAWREVAA
ncbi:MAG: 5-formyltetrahydrofolate cyclo-ligase [Trueperaceae bacterium]|nr:5-formyltetrahydrofolate cyclo-ligase [Trueperaceae bacterium]MCC6311496.1 5-formyltetrahydrofolate cyclo-ligase [Trueperaceae bacterium]MCO5173320.1 5-formyltetrahydrofolate cyclo-ligase [Trueperaceae bacterium]MCW5818388.1 5-formyltetrahydrofolate cyclo-ligase [Trueperaceae bacterium]